MKCQQCGSQNEAEAVFCHSCGNALGVVAPGKENVAMRSCPSCGRSIRLEFVACPHCGHNFVTRSMLGPPPAQIGTGKRIAIYTLSLLIPIAGLIVGLVYMSRKDEVSKHVGTISLVLGVVSMVVIVPVVLAAILYVMVLGFSVDGGGMTPVAIYSTSTITNGKKVTILSMTSNSVPWDDITIVLQDPSASAASWTPMKEDLNDNAGDSMNYTGKALGSLTVCCWVFDIAGNGVVDGGDSVTLFTYGGATGFSSGQTYSAQFLYEPTGERIGNPVIWTG